MAVRDATRPGIVCYSPKGEELAYIPTPIPTNVAFGRGEKAKTLYMTYGIGMGGEKSVLARIEVEVEGYQLPSP